MPIYDDPEPESPHADTRMLEFVERRREEQARARRQRIQLIAIIALGLIGIVLTVSNAVLVSRLVARPVTPPAVMPPPPVRSAVPAMEPEEPMAPSAAVPPKKATPARTTRRGSTPSPQPSASASSMPSQESEASDPAARPSESPGSSLQPPAAARDEPPALPERVTRTPRPAAVPDGAWPSAARETVSTAVETDPALRTARWMIRTYGPLDAEGKALAAAEFYTGEEGEFWRRVIAHVRTGR